MRAYLTLGPLSLVLLTGAIASSKPPTIQGSYRLVERDLTDGTKQVPPDIVGMITYTAKYRNFNIYWKDKDGKPVSISTIAGYQLTPKEYRETNIYSVVNDESRGKDPIYDLSSTSAASPVTLKGGRIEMQLPLHDEPKIAFEGNKFTATMEGAFVDHWERVP
jgi:hypothetical protein